MKFVITRTSSDEYMVIKNFSSIHELINFRNKTGHKLIIKSNFWYKEKESIEDIKNYYPNVNAEEVITIPNEIEIYDDYRE